MRKRADSGPHVAEASGPPRKVTSFKLASGDAASTEELHGRSEGHRRVYAHARNDKSPPPGQKTQGKLQDHLFKMALKQKEQAAAKRLEQDRQHGERRVRITGTDSTANAPVGCLKRALLPWSER
jgi:hypothetical protein